MAPTTLIEHEKDNAESWKDGNERGCELVQQLRALCRSITGAGEAIESEDLAHLMAMMDAQLGEIESLFDDLKRLLSAIERVGPNNITMKKREAV